MNRLHLSQRIEFIIYTWMPMLLLILIVNHPVLAQSPFQFIENAQERGLNFQQVNGTRHKEYIVEAKGAGVAVADVNGDGWDDIYLVNGQDWSEQPGEHQPRNQLFLNQGDGSFKDATEETGLGDTGFGTGAFFADVDRDGDLDCYLTNYGPNQLYINDGKGRFSPVPNAGGAQNEGWSTGAAFADINGDGFLDLYVAQYAYFSKERAEKKGKFSSIQGEMAFLGPSEFEPAQDNLFISNGDGTFRDETQKRGINAFSAGRAFSVCFTDLDNDGDLDLYVANDTSMNNLYENMGDGYFEDISLIAGVGLSENGEEQGGMGLAVQDIDGDLDLDIVVTNYQDEYIILYRNEGGMLFSDASYVTGVWEGSTNKVSFGVSLEDFDNDSWPDIFVANGHVYEIADRLPSMHGYPQESLFYWNKNKGIFSNISSQIGPASRLKGISRGCATADFDRDGDLDIVVNNLDGTPYFLENQSTERNWIQIVLQDERNMPAYGAKLTLETPERTQVTELYSSHSFLSQNSACLHFGLGGSDAVKRIVIRWPDGSITEKQDLNKNQRLVIGKQ